jgi:hypothetical protein
LPESGTSVPVGRRRTGTPAGAGPAALPAAGTREDGGVKTRTLLILAAVTGLLILAAGALQIFLAR